MRLLTLLLVGLCAIAVSADPKKHHKKAHHADDQADDHHHHLHHDDHDSVDSDLVEKNMRKWAEIQYESSKVPSPGEHSYSLIRPEGKRSYFIYVPKHYTGQTSFPLLLTFHGLGNSCTDFGRKAGFQALADSNNFLYVYPCSMKGLLGNAWNAGTCCLQPTNVDDVEFTREIVADVSKKFRVNKHKIYVSGFSNGAMMAERLLCEASDIFSAAASVSGIVELEPGNDQGLAACDESFSKFNKSISLLHIHGDFDPVVPYTGDAILGFPPVPQDTDRWVERNDCHGNATTTFKKGAYSNQVWKHCPHGNKIELVRHSLGGHVWPRDKDFSAPNYIVNFFASLP